MRCLGILILCLVGIVVGSEVAIACECHRKRPIAEEFENSQAVFLGQVMEISTNGQEDVIKSKVEKIWKGSSSKETVLTSPWLGKRCQFKFQADKESLVYAFGTEKPGTTTCSRTALSESASEDMQRLGDGKKP